MVYLVALSARMYSLKSMLPLLSSSKTLKRESARNLASWPSTASRTRKDYLNFVVIFPIYSIRSKTKMKDKDRSKGKGRRFCSVFNFYPRTQATTFAFASVFILLLWSKTTMLIHFSNPLSSIKLIRFNLIYYFQLKN